MRTNFFNIVLFTCIIAFAACKPNEPVDKPSQVVYSLDSAKKNIDSFQAISQRLMQKCDSIKAFTVRAVDLFAAMGMTYDPKNCTYHHIRVYLGYNTNINQFKLFIVPVDSANILIGKAGKDIMLNANGTPDTIAGSQKYVLDLNAPCPNLCDVTSPLTNQ